MWKVGRLLATAGLMLATAARGEDLGDWPRTIELPTFAGEGPFVTVPANVLGMPTLVIVGGRDVPSIVENADRLAAGIAGARQVILPNVAHLPPMEAPDEFNRLVLDFLGAR